MTPDQAMTLFQTGLQSLTGETESDALRLATWFAMNSDKLGENDVSVIVGLGSAVLAHEGEIAWRQGTNSSASPAE